MKILLIASLLFFLFGCKINEKEYEMEIYLNKQYEVTENIKILECDDKISVNDNKIVGIEVGQAVMKIVYNDERYTIFLNIVEDFSEINDYILSIQNENIERKILIANTYYYSGYNSVLKYLNNDLVVRENLIQKGNARPGIKRDIKWIVIHETANVNADALSHEKYLTNLAIENKQSVSWHYSIDDKNIIRHVPDDEVAYHAGDGLIKDGGNLNGIGIEINVNKGSDFIKSLHNTAKLVASLMVKYDLTIESVKRHSDFANKNCPMTINENGMLEELLSYIEAEYMMLTKYADFSISFLGAEESGRKTDLNTEYKIIVTNLKTGFSKQI